MSLYGITNNKSSYIDSSVNNAYGNTAIVNKNPISDKLEAGSTVTGKIIDSKDGNASIDLGNGKVVNAKIEGNVNLKAGDTVTFNVKGTSANQLTLSPLYTNTSNTSTVIKALTYANLPISENSIKMADSMINQSMNIDAKSLSFMFRQVSSFPESNPASIVEMHKLGLDINADNIESFEAFKNYENQVTSALNDIVDAMPDAFNQLRETGTDSQFTNFALDVINTFTNNISSDSELTNNISNNPEIINKMELDPDFTNKLNEISNLAQNDPGKALEIINTMPKDEAVLVLKELQINNKEGFNNIVTDMLKDNQSALNSLITDNLASTDNTVNSLKELFSSDPAKFNEAVNKLINNDISSPDINNLKAIILNNPAKSMDAIKNLVNDNPELAGKLLKEIADNSPKAMETVIKNASPESLDKLLNNITKVNDSSINENDAYSKFTTFEKSNLIDALKASGLDDATAKFLISEEASSKDFLLATKEILEKGNISDKLKEMISSDKFGQLIKGEMQNNWMLSPYEVGQKETVESLYKKLIEGAKNLTESLSENAVNNTALSANLSEMNNNLDFMNQMNNIYQYVQLPLKMNGSEATGDLFVYTDKKSLARKDGNVSALLHLDMNNLGPLDVYASITPGNNVYTKFYLQDDDTLDFIEANIHILNERLESRGYNMKCEASTKDSLNKDKLFDSTTAPSNNPNMSKIMKYSFDMKA